MTWESDVKLSAIFAIGTAICGLSASVGNAQAAVPDAGGSPAEAQQPSAAQQQQPATTAPPAESPDSATPGTSFSDTELEQFAKAAMAIQDIQQDTGVATADKQTKAAAAVQQSGLTPAKFNEIANASRSDPALMQRIQLAAGKVQGTSTP